MKFSYLPKKDIVLNEMKTQKVNYTSFQQQVNEINNGIIKLDEYQEKSFIEISNVDSFFKIYNIFIHKILGLLKQLDELDVEENNKISQKGRNDIYILLNRKIVKYGNKISEYLQLEKEEFDINKSDELFLTHMNNFNFSFKNNSNSEEPDYNILKENTVSNETDIKINNSDTLSINIKLLLNNIINISEEYSETIENIIKRGDNIPYDILIKSNYKYVFNEILNIAKKYKLSNLHKKILNNILLENYKFIYSEILSNQKLTKEEKIEKIKESYKEILENNYNFDFRESLSSILGDIFKINNLSEGIFEGIEYSDNGKPNRNIRIQYIKNNTDLEQVINYVENCKNLGRRSTIEFLKRIEKAIIQGKEKYINIFNKYFLLLESRVENSDNKNSSDIDANNKFYKFKKESKIIKEDNVVESTKSSLKEILEPKKEISYKTDIINELEFEDLIINGLNIYYVIVILNNNKNNFKKQNIFNILIKHFNEKQINNFLKLNIFKETNKEKLIFEYIKIPDSESITNNLDKLITIINNYKIKINKKYFLLKLYKQNYNLFEVVSIIGNQFFNDISLLVEDNNKNINKIDAEIFFKYYNSSNKTILQHIGFFNEYRNNFQGKYVITQNKKYIFIHELKTNNETKIKLN